MLDVEEYVHLAIHASRSKNHHAALLHLKAALEIEPGHVVARTLLAGEHAELGLHQRAARELQLVLEQHPDVEIARFQLGLLLLQLGRLSEARENFGILGHRAKDEAMRTIALGYMSLFDKDIERARTLLTQGAERCSNVALKADIQGLLASLPHSGSPTEVAPVEEAHDSGTNPIAAALFLSAYKDSLESK